MARHSAMRTLARATTEADGSLDGLQFIPVQMFASHALIIILSPLAPNDWQLFPRLRAYGLLSAAMSSQPVEILGVDPAREPLVTTLDRQVTTGRYLQPLL